MCWARIFGEGQALPLPLGLFEPEFDWPTVSSVSRLGFVESVDRYPRGDKELFQDLRWGLRPPKGDLN